MDELPYLDQTRTAYDTVARDYAELLRGALEQSTWDRGVLGMVAELIQRGGGGAVADIGCGPGRVTSHLHDLGLDASGIDLSPGMVAVARQTYPHLRFEVGSLAATGLPDESLAAAIAWYSIIHTPTEHVPAVLTELHRVLAPGGYLLLAFQVGDERLHFSRGYGHEIDLVNYRRQPETVVGLLERAGFKEVARVVRAPEGREKTPQAYVVARRSRA